MNDQIETPSKGQPLKAGWGASVANNVNRLIVAAPARSLVRESAGGFGFEPLPENLRDKRPKNGDTPETDRQKPDERSISRMSASPDPSEPDYKDDFWSVKGFGRWRQNGETGFHGTFDPSSTVKIGAKAWNGKSALVRMGDADSVGGNSLAYVRLLVDVDSIRSELAKDENPSPFRYVEDVDEDTGEVIGWKLEKCRFYFDGTYHDLGDYTIPSGPSAGTVYLVCAKDDGEWSFEVSDTPGDSEDHDQVLNFKIYDWADGKVACDYRTTFLALNSKDGLITPQPFDIVDDGHGGKTITNCTCYVNGVTCTTEDFSAPESGSVYLRVVNLSETTGGEYGIELATSGGSGAFPMEVKLYDFSEGKVTSDYRATFLNLTVPVLPSSIMLGNDNQHLSLNRMSDGTYVLSVPKITLPPVKTVKANVVTEITFALSKDGTKLQATVYKTPVDVVGSVLPSPTQSVVNITDVVRQLIVERANYDDGTHKFTTTNKDVKVLAAGAPKDVAATTLVFEATPHSSEGS